MRVLMVEDEVRLAETVARGLTAEGFVVDIVHDGAEGLALAETGDFDVIVLDIMLRRCTVTRCAGGCARRASGPPCSC